MYLSVLIRYILIPTLSRSKIFILRSFRSLSLNMILVGPKPNSTITRTAASLVRSGSPLFLNRDSIGGAPLPVLCNDVPWGEFVRYVYDKISIYESHRREYLF
jgi:hypothetical protein